MLTLKMDQRESDTPRSSNRFKAWICRMTEANGYQDEHIQERDGSMLPHPLMLTTSAPEATLHPIASSVVEGIASLASSRRWQVLIYEAEKCWAYQGST